MANSSDEYDEKLVRMRYAKGTTPDLSRKTAGASRATLRDKNNKLAGQAELFDVDPSEFEYTDYSYSESDDDDEAGYSVGALVALGLAGAAGVFIARRMSSKATDHDDPGKQCTSEGSLPAGWYEIGDSTGALRYWDGSQWTSRLEQPKNPASVAPANWYLDPSNAAQYRYWDGSAWTSQTAPRYAPQEPPADWYPDPNDGTRWRYWNGAMWTAHVAPGCTNLVDHHQVHSIATETLAAASDGPQTRRRMTGAEWEEVFRAWLAAGVVQEELWALLTEAELVDVNETLLLTRDTMRQVTPEQARQRIHTFLEANPRGLDHLALAHSLVLVRALARAPGRTQPLIGSGQQSLPVHE